MARWRSSCGVFGVAVDDITPAVLQQSASLFPHVWIAIYHDISAGSFAYILLQGHTQTPRHPPAQSLYGHYIFADASGFLQRHNKDPVTLVECQGEKQLVWCACSANAQHAPARRLESQDQLHASSQISVEIFLIRECAYLKACKVHAGHRQQLH